MNKTRAKIHPGARMFGNAMAGLRIPTAHGKCKPAVLKKDIQSSESIPAECSRLTEIPEVSVPVFPERDFFPLEDKSHHSPGIDYNFQENAIPNDAPDEEDYSLPLTQSASPLQFNVPPAYHPNPQHYPTPHPFNCTENSTYCSPNSFSSGDNTMYYLPSASTPSMYPSEYLIPSVQRLNPSMDSFEYFYPSVQRLNPSLDACSSDVYAFSVSRLPSDSPGLEDLDQSSEDPLNVSTDYNLPLMIPGESQDSGCLSEDSNSSETSVKDNSLPHSMSYYHTVNSSESSPNAQRALNAGSPEEPATQTKANPRTVARVRVGRRSISRVQGPSTSLPTRTKTTETIPIPRRSLTVPSPLYVTTDVSDDSGTEVSADDESRTGCINCEKESNLLYKADLQNRWKRLPDYSRLNFLTFKSDPGFIDSHCHLDFLFQRQNYDGTYADYMFKHRDTYPASYKGCVAVFCNPHTFHKKTMWQKYLNENGVWGAFGCHPHNSNAYSDVMESDLCDALLHSKVRALGEIGLDYSNRNDCSKEKQCTVFKRQLNIAMNRKLPLVIHCRDANEDIMNIMKETLPKNHTIHLHCFTDGWDWAQKWLKQFPNLFIGITNLVTYNSAEPTHEVARKIPLDRLLLETDAPYFIPRRSPRTTKFSHPGMAIHVAAQIATLRGQPLKEIIHRTRQNTKKMYGI